MLSAKLLMRQMCNEDVKSCEWDASLDPEMLQKWIKCFRTLFEVEELHYSRYVKPRFAIKNPILVVFSDGSDLSYGCCAYVRSEVAGGTYAASLLAAKNRIAPKKKISTPRLELCGAVLASRLRETIEKSMDTKFSAIFHITDSTIVRWQIQKESHGFKTFVATRIGEIQSKTDPEEWWWVGSEFNPAYLTAYFTVVSEAL